MMSRFAGRVLPALLVLLVPVFTAADPLPPPVLDAARLRLALEKLRVTGTALYVAAHPDDENTAMLTWLANGVKVRTGYLSMTRGDGGQNLIGSDVGDRLGVIRTQELLAARRIDDAEQYFTRAIDFGYSKNAQETLEIWGHDTILSDVVRVIRTLRPDVIVTRFAPDSTAGHGHHTSSAMLAEEAFAAAADPAKFPDQITQGLKPWQAKRLVWNAYRFGAAGVDTTPGRIRVDLGTYDPLLGRSFTELAGESRSMHKSQGFGAAERRGVWENSYQHKLGDKATRDLFEGVDLTWKRIPGGQKVDALLARALKDLNPERPQAILPILFQARDAMAKLPDDPIVRHRRAQLDEVIRSAAGLRVEAIAPRPLASPLSNVRVALSVLDRTGVGTTIRTVSVSPGGPQRETRVAELAANTTWADTVNVEVRRDAPITGPYWLAAPPVRGAATVADPARIGEPESPPAMVARFELTVLGRPFEVETPVVHRWVDPVQGERYRTLEIAPPVRMKFDREVRLAATTGPANGSGRTRLGVVVGALDVAQRGTLTLAVPEKWSVKPASYVLGLRPGTPDTTVYFDVEAGTTATEDHAAAGQVRSVFEAMGRKYDTRVVELDYAHIPLQTMQPPAIARVVHAQVRSTARNVGYVMGSGDAGPDVLREMGATVTLLEDADLESGDLSRFDVIVVGVRAYNTRPRMRSFQPRLNGYMANGGRLVVQYQTAEGGLRDKIGPYPLTVSRDRVTVEQAEMRTVIEGHSLLTTPNKIEPGDYDGWVQERGLYFANPFDVQYDAVLSLNDPNEPARRGALLYAKYGKGTFIYTGLAFFRQLPAGVPGAWRLFANLVSPER